MSKSTYTVLGGGVNHDGWWRFRLQNNATGKEVDKSRKEVANLRRAGRITELVKCGKCDGRGWYLERFSDSHRTQCDHCGGSGKVQAAANENKAPHRHRS